MPTKKYFIKVVKPIETITQLGCVEYYYSHRNTQTNRYIFHPNHHTGMQLYNHLKDAKRRCRAFENAMEVKKVFKQIGPCHFEIHEVDCYTISTKDFVTNDMVNKSKIVYTSKKYE